MMMDEEEEGNDDLACVLWRSTGRSPTQSRGALRSRPRLQTGHRWLEKARHARHSSHTGDDAPSLIPPHASIPPPSTRPVLPLLGFSMQPRSGSAAAVALREGCFRPTALLT